MKTIAALLFVLPAVTLVADETAADIPWFQDRLTGEWNGARTRLLNHGVDAFAYYNGIVASNVSGGLRKETNYAGDIFAGLQFDLERIAGWENTTFTVSGINRHGSSIDPAVGGQYSVMQLVGGQSTFLYGVYLEKTFKNDAVTLKLGRMAATDDFVGSPLYSYSLNNSVNGQIRAALFDGVMTSYPFPVWGGRLKVKTSEHGELMLGVFQISKDMFDPDKHGVDFSIASDDGVSLFTQYDWKSEVAGRPVRVYVGMNNAWLDLEEFDSTAVTHHFLRLYGHADIQLYRESETSDEGLTLFATLAYTSQDEIAIIPVQSTFGGHYKGLLPGRPEDRTAFFVTYGGFSDAYSAQRARSGGSEADYEMVIELGHRIQLTKSAYIQPDIQVIKRPGGTGQIDDAVVLGVQFGASF